MSCGVWRRLLENWKRTVCATKRDGNQAAACDDWFRPDSAKIPVFLSDTLDFVPVPGYPSAILIFALTHSRRNVVQR